MVVQQQSGVVIGTHLQAVQRTVRVTKYRFSAQHCAAICGRGLFHSDIVFGR